MYTSSLVYLGYLPYVKGGNVQYIWPNAYYFGLSIRRTDREAITDSDVTAIQAALYYYSLTDKTLTQANCPADAKTVGQMLDDMGATNEPDEKGWLNYSLNPDRRDYDSLIVPGLHNGEINYSTGVATEDKTSVKVYTDLFTIDDDVFFSVSVTGIRWRLAQYNKTTGDFVSATSWTGED